MKMQEIQMSSKTGKTMTMTGIKQAERSQFLSKPMLDPGREAYKRAEGYGCNLPAKGRRRLPPGKRRKHAHRLKGISALHPARNMRHA